MAGTAKKIKEISLDEDFGDVVVKIHGARIEVHTDGSILAYTDRPVKVQPVANNLNSPATIEQKPGDNAAPRIGEIMPDGTVYAGISPDTQKPMYAMPADAPLAMTFNEAAEHAKTANSQKTYGHDDWRVPTKNELNVMFNNRAAITGFDLSGSCPAGWYWSATPYGKWNAWCQRLIDGVQFTNVKDALSSVHLVR
jgi:hypothetical protein